MAASASRGRGWKRAVARAALASVAALPLGGALASCGEDPLGAPRPSSGSGGGGGGLIDIGDDGGPPPLDAAGLCGNQLHQVVTDAPNIYFLIDASGSMSIPASGSATRYDRVRSAAIDMVRRLGALINVGAALFPRDAASDGCHAGGEVLAVRPGDPYVEGQGDGPTTKAFGWATAILPEGGTPLAATLEALTPTLTGLAGKTIVVLATDGGPNCNEAASCPPEECIPYIEGAGCDATCCEPGGPAGPTGCVDRAAAVAAVAAVAAADIDVYVIGIPGSELYGDVLDDMAIAGGAPRFVSPFYYKVDNLDALGGVLGEIAAVVVSCEFDLQDPPPEQGKTNVYLDTSLIPYSETDGWRWKSDTVVELVGEPCQRLKAGQVRRVQIVSGCPTEVAE